MSPVPEVAFEVTDDGYFRVLRHQAEGSRLLDDALRKNRRNVIVAGLIGAAAMMVWGYARASDRPAVGLLRAAIHGLVFAAIWVVYFLTSQSRAVYRRRWERIMRRSLANGSFPRPKGACRIALLSESLLIACGGTSTTFAWASIRRVTRTDDEVFIDFDDQSTVRVPLAAFGSQAERLAYLGTLEAMARSNGVECPRLA